MARHVVTPDHVEWQVGRVWLSRRPRFRLRKHGGVGAESLASSGGSWPDLGGIDSAQGLLLVVAAVAVVIVLIPLLFFGIELIILGLLLAGGLIGRVLFGRPWVIEARSADPVASGRVLEWRVRGWRNSSKAIERVARDLEAGREPPEAL